MFDPFHLFRPRTADALLNTLALVDANIADDYDAMKALTPTDYDDAVRQLHLAAAILAGLTIRGLWAPERTRDALLEAMTAEAGAADTLRAEEQHRWAHRHDTHHYPHDLDRKDDTR